MVSNPLGGGENAIQVQLEGDGSGLEGALAGAEKNLMSFKGAAGAAGAALGALAVGGLAASVNAAADFDKAMQESIAVMGDVSDSMREDLEETARDVAKTTTASHEEAASSYYYLASAGLEAQEAMEAMPEVAAFASAGQMDMAEATDVATNVMSAYGYEADEMTKVTDTLSATVSSHNQTMEGMSSAMSQVAPIASSLGVSIEETSAAIGMMGDVGIQSEKAGTQLRNVLSQLSDESSTASQQLEEMGVQVRDNEGNVLSLSKILENMKDAGVEAGDAAQIFGRRAGPAMAALIEEGGGALEENTKNIREMEGATQDIAETQRDTFNAQLGIFKSQLKDIGVEIGENLLPILNNLLDEVSRAVESFSALNSESGGLIGTFTLIGTAIGGAGAALAFFVGGPVTLAIGAAAALAAAWAMGWEDTKKAISDGVDAATEALGQISKWIQQNGPRIAQDTIDIFQTMVRDAASWIQSNGPSLIGRAFRAIGRGIRFVALDIYNGITGNGDSILKSIIIDAGTWLVNNGPGILKSAAKTAFDAIIAAAVGLYQGLIGNSLIPEMFRDIQSYISQTGRSLLSSAIDSVIEGVKSAFNYLTGTGAGTLLGDTKSAISGVASWITNGAASDLESAAKSAFGDAKDAALEPMEELEDLIKGIIEDIQERIDAVMDRINNAKESAGNLGGGAKDKATGAVDKASDAVGGVVPSLDTGGKLASDGLYMGHEGERVLNPAETKRLEELGAGGGTQEVDVSVNVNAEGSGQLAEFVQENAEVVIERKERRTHRNSGRNPSPR